MDTMALQNALRECAERATRLDVYVVHHAVNFTEVMATLRDPNNEGELCKLVGIEFVAKHERANHSMTHPSHETVRNHVRWLLKNLPPREKPGKRSRWVGFAAGAAARIRLAKGYYTKDLADPGDIERLAMLAALPNSSRHYRATSRSATSRAGSGRTVMRPSNRSGG